MFNLSLRSASPSPDGAPGLVLDTVVLLCTYLLGAKRFRFLRVSAKSRVSDFAMAVGVGAGWPACARRPAGDLGTDAAPLDRVADGGGDRQTDRWARRRSSPWGSLSPRRRRGGAAAAATSRDAKWQRTWSTRSLPTPRARPRTASASATGTRPRRHRRRPPRPCRRRSRAARDDRDDFRDGRDRVGAPPGADGADGRPADRRGPRTAARRGGNSRVPDRVPGRQYKTVLTVWALCTDAWTVSTSRRTRGFPHLFVFPHNSEY